MRGGVEQNDWNGKLIVQRCHGWAVKGDYCRNLGATTVQGDALSFRLQGPRYIANIFIIFREKNRNSIWALMWALIRRQKKNILNWFCFCEQSSRMIEQKNRYWTTLVLAVRASRIHAHFGTHLLSVAHILMWYSLRDIFRHYRGWVGNLSRLIPLTFPP